MDRPDDLALTTLVADIRACRLCEPSLPHGARPVIQVGSRARVLVVGQAPGRRVHESGVPFDDPSGDRLRLWMGVSRAQFYDPKQIALVPMGFCYPGTGKSGDLPPRSECTESWRAPLLALLPDVEFTLVIGQYAIGWHLADRKKNLTETVRAWRQYGPEYLPLPHPSPRNNRWLKNNGWFEANVVPHLQQRVQALLPTP